MEGIHSTRGGEIGGLERVKSTVELQCTGGGGLQRFWARRARTSIDVLGLGITSRQGGWFWGVLRRSIRFKRREQAAADSIRVRYVNSNSWIVYLDLLLIAKFYLRKC
jgi:hypothetical protein